MIGQQVAGEQGTFTPLREIGRGGFGIVYLAEDDKGQQYALKVIGPVSDPDVWLSFEQEIKSTVGLAHENILNVIDYGSCTLGSKQGLFAVSEFCPDGDYSQLTGTGGRRSIDEVTADFRQILSGLRVLHTRIIHRDIKPENIMVRNGRLKIGDFGLAKFVDAATRTLTFKGAGTPLYMAPEVWTNQRATRATDLYAIGAMLFEALTGRPPFMAEDANALRDQHLYTPAPRAKTLNPDTPDLLDGIVKKLLAKEPGARYQTASDVLEALEAVPAIGGAEIQGLAERIRRLHDAAEKQRLSAQKEVQSEQDSAARSRYKEQELIALIDEVISEINAHLPEIKISRSSRRDSLEYRFGNRVLRVHFFAPNEMLANPVVPGRMETLRKRHVVHGGYLEVKEGSEDREGWNVVLVRSPESIYGEWRIVETRVSALVARRARYEPLATEAQLFADNLACHWAPAMHTFVLKDKLLERSDIMKILDAFIPQT